jgi:hypothetical protein
VSEAVDELPPPLLETLRVALRLLFTDGANFTPIEHVPPAAMVAPHVLELML